jgi:hypothetical protein
LMVRRAERPCAPSRMVIHEFTHLRLNLDKAL